MKRDDDLIRQLLFRYEAQDDWVVFVPDTVDMSKEERLEQYHILLLVDQALMTTVGKSTARLTAQGHDFLQAIRDDGIWSKTKAIVAEEGGNATLALLNQIAVALLKKKFTDLTGLNI